MQEKTNFFQLKYWPVHFLFFVCKLIAALPLNIKIHLGRLLGKLLYLLAKRRRRIAQINIDICFPDASESEKNNRLKENFALTGLALIESANCWFGSLKKQQQNTNIVGMQHLDEALAKGKGVILLSFHLTSLEIGGCLLGKHYPITAMYKPNKNPLIEHMMCQGRLKHVAHLVKQNDVRGVIKSLKNNQILWYATDQNYGPKSSVFVPFFGIQTATITATTKFTRLTGATVIPFTQKRIENGKGFELTLHPALTEIPGENETFDAACINQFLENYLKQYPEDYMWIHQRFRTRPAGEAPIY